MELEQASVRRVVREFDDVELGDPRRSKRLPRIVEQFAKHPNLSFPRMFSSEAELEAAYRFFGNEAFDYDDLLEAHREHTIRRAEQVAKVLALHDTTTCRFEHGDPCEIGYLPTGAAGFFAHVCLLVDAQRHRRPLGVLHVEPISRARRSGRGSRKKHVSGRETARWKGRESERWIRGVETCRDHLSRCVVVHVMDREGDAYELLAHLRQQEERFVIRSRHDRRLASEYGEPSLRELAKQQPVVLTRDVHLSRRLESSAPRSRKLAPARQARAATLQVTAAAVTLRRPNSANRDLPQNCAINVVHVEEHNPPDGQAPVVWTLLTSEPIETADQVAEIIDMYRYRWLIEELFKAFKSGCLYEKRQFETLHALLNLMAVSLPIAVELLWMRSRVADDPNGPGSEIATEQQVEILRAMGHRPLPQSPTALQVLLAIAGLGGHLKRNGSPGWHVLHRGYERLLDYEAGWVLGAASARRRSSSERRNL